jgi:hypothetical protein
MRVSIGVNILTGVSSSLPTAHIPYISKRHCLHTGTLAIPSSTDFKKKYLQGPAMSLIRVVEGIIGSIENSPTYIIEYLFCEISDLAVLENLIAFYVNGIPCPVACQF